MRHPLLLAFLLVVTVPAGGCLGMDVAHTPAETLEAKGWVLNETAGFSNSAWGGLARTEVLVYEHAKGGGGFGGALTVVTQRSYLDPDEEELREELQERVRRQAESRGITIDEEAMQGVRENEAGISTAFFTYNGTAGEEGLFARHAKVRIIGEVWNCRAARTTVIGIGLAQVEDVRTISGVVVPGESDLRTWADIVADPDGNIQAQRGNGLLYRTSCGGD